MAAPVLDWVRIGALAAVVAMVLGRSLAETATAETMHTKEAGSVVGLVRNHPRAVLIVLAILGIVITKIQDAIDIWLGHWRIS